MKRTISTLLLFLLCLTPLAYGAEVCRDNDFCQEDIGHLARMSPAILGGGVSGASTPNIQADGTATTGIANNATTATVAHTCNGDNRFLYVVVSSASRHPTGVTYNSDVLTKAWEANTTGVYVSAWYMVAPDSGSSYDTVVTFESGTYANVGVMSYTGVAQSDTIATTGTASKVYGASASVTISSGTGQLVLDAVAVTGAYGAEGENQTLIVSKGNYDPRLTASSEPGASSVTMSWSWTGDRYNAVNAISINPS